MQPFLSVYLAQDTYQLARWGRCPFKEQVEHTSSGGTLDELCTGGNKTLSEAHLRVLQTTTLTELYC